ncbi:MAG: alpha/beta hydrolase, partial [Pseudomonadota bacterium]
ASKRLDHLTKECLDAFAVRHIHNPRDRIRMRGRHVDQLPALASEAHVIAMDQRGHGASTNAGPYTEAQHVADLIGFLDALTIERCDLLGHSFGGMVALRAVLDHPERFRSLVLMDTAPGPLTLFPPKVKAYLDQLVTEGGCQALLKGMRDAPPNAAAQRGIDFLGEAEHWRRITVKLEQMDPAAFRDLGNYFAEREDLTERMSELNCPVTVVVGAEDAPFIEPSKVMAEAAADAELVVISEAGHSPQYENAPSWTDAIRAHLQGLRG